MTTEAAGLGATIRAWRNRLSPAAAGLPARHARRATGLRREELAELAGLSVDYVVRLEQGRSTTPSAQVAAALARALQLTVAERDHLFRLAHLAPPADDRISDHIPPGVQRVVARLGDAATAIFAADWQLIWWNRGWAALLGDPAEAPPAVRNFARDTFLTAPGATPRLSRWPVVSLDGDATKAAIVADLRGATGRFPRDQRLARLIRDLTGDSPEFAALWASGTVGAHREDRKIIHHPGVGPVTIDCDVLSGGETGLKIVIMTAVPGSADETKLRLAAVAGSQIEGDGVRADQASR